MIPVRRAFRGLFRRGSAINGKLPFSCRFDRCRRERRREHARYHSSLAPSSLGDYPLCSSVSSDQTWESESKEDLRFNLSPFPFESLSLRPRFFEETPSRSPRGLRPEVMTRVVSSIGINLDTEDSKVVTQKFGSTRNSIVTRWPATVVTTLCVNSRSSSFPLSPLILHRPIQHQGQALSRLVTPSYIRP